MYNGESLVSEIAALLVAASGDDAPPLRAESHFYIFNYFPGLTWYRELLLRFQFYVLPAICRASLSMRSLTCSRGQNFLWNLWCGALLVYFSLFAVPWLDYFEVLFVFEDYTFPARAGFALIEMSGGTAVTLTLFLNWKRSTRDWRRLALTLIFSPIRRARRALSSFMTTLFGLEVERLCLRYTSRWISMILFSPAAMGLIAFRELKAAYVLTGLAMRHVTAPCQNRLQKIRRLWEK